VRDSIAAERVASRFRFTRTRAAETIRFASEEVASA